MAKVRTVLMTIAKITNGKNFPKGLKLIDGTETPIAANASPRPLPAVGFFKNGLTFGSSYASPTGFVFAS